MGLHVAVIGIAEIRRNVGVGRPALKRRDPTVGDASVAKVFVAKGDLRPGVGRDRQRRTDTVPLEIDRIPEALRARLSEPVPSRSAGLEFA